MDLSLDTLDFIYFIIVIAVYIILEKMFKSRNIMLEEDPMVKIIREDQEEFIMQIVLVCVCAVMMFVFPANMANILKITFGYIAWICRPEAAHRLRVKEYNLSDDPRYKKVVPVMEYSGIFGFLVVIFIEVLQMQNIIFSIALLLATVVLSLWGIKELEKIKQDYLL